MSSGDVLLAVIALLVMLQLFVTRTEKSAARAQQTGRAAPSSRVRLPLSLERRDPLPAAAKIMMPPPPPGVRVDVRRRHRPRAARFTPAEARQGIRWMTILGPCRGQSPPAQPGSRERA